MSRNPLPRMRNPRELPSLIREAIARVKSGESVDQAANWVWFHGASRAERDAVDTYIIETKHRLGFEAGTAEQRFKELIRESVREKNPRELRKYREIGRGIDFDGWYKITLETIPDHRIVKVSKKRFADLKRAGRIEGNLEKNPIRRVKGGYRWGEHGHVYPTRAGAFRQARAAFAHGYVPRTGYREKNVHHDRKHPGYTSKLPGVDFSSQAYRGYLIRVNALSNEMWIEKDGHLIHRVPADKSWAYARKEIDNLVGEREHNPGRVHNPRGLDYDRYAGEIRTKYVSNRAGRGGVKASMGEKSLTFPYDHALSSMGNHRAAAVLLAKKRGFSENAIASEPARQSRGGYYWPVLRSGRESNPARGIRVPRYLQRKSR